MVKLEEAKEHMKRGEAALKKNIFALKFSADYMTAASEFSEAAQAFASAGSREEANSAWIRAGECRLKENDHFSAGRCFETAGAFDRAAECFGLAGKADSAARALMKQAEADPSKSHAAFEKVIAMYTLEDDNKAILSIDIFRQYLQKIGTSDLDKYAEISQRLSEVFKRVGQWAYVHKEILTLVIIALSQKDTIKARKILDESMNGVQDWVRSNEFSIAEDLLESVSDHDDEKLQLTLKKQILTFLRPEVFRIAQTLKTQAQNKDGDSLR